MGTVATAYAILLDSIRKATLKILNNGTADRHQSVSVNCQDLGISCIFPINSK